MGEIREVPLGQEVRAAIADAQPGDVIVLEPGRYVDEQTTAVTDKADLEIQGNGATLAFTDPSITQRRNLLIERSQGIVVRDLTLEGCSPQPGRYDPEHAFEHGVQVQGSAGTRLIDVHTLNTRGDGIWLGHEQTGAGQFMAAVDTSVIDCGIVGAGRQGISIGHTQDTFVSGIAIDNIGRSAMDMEPPGSLFAQRCTITNFDVGRARNIFFTCGGGGGEDVVVLGGRVTGMFADAWVTGWKNQPARVRNFLIGGYVGSEPGPGTPRQFWIRYAENVQIVGVTQPYPDDRYVLQTVGAKDVRLIGGTFPGANPAIWKDDPLNPSSNVQLIANTT